jgi:hypothetical protein
MKEWPHPVTYSLQEKVFGVIWHAISEDFFLYYAKKLETRNLITPSIVDFFVNSGFPGTITGEA